MQFNCILQDGRTLIDLGEFYDKHFLRPFRGHKGRTPASSGRTSQLSFDAEQAVLKGEMKTNMHEYTYPENHQQAKKSALLRDNFQCVVSGKVDLSASDGTNTCITECAHIFGEPTDGNLDQDAKASTVSSPLLLAYAATGRTVLQSFGYSEIWNHLAGAKIHHLDNVLSMDSRLRMFFDDLKLWFENTDICHCYKVVSTRRAAFASFHAREFVTFQSAEARLALPKPEYLRIHAACCRIAHMSGAAVYYQLLDRDDEEYSPTGGVPADVLVARLYDISTSQLYRCSNDT